MDASIKYLSTFLEKSYKKNMPSKIIEFFKSSKSQKAKKTIRVQPRSVQRRVVKKNTSFSKHLKPRGLKKIQARKHSLAQAIRENRQNSGK